MISLANQELLGQAIMAVKSRRESQAQAAQAQASTKQAQGFDMAKTKMGLSAKVAGAKPGAKGAVKKGAKKPKAGAAGPTQPGSSAISPYLESADLLAMGERGQADDHAVANTNFSYEVAAANAIRASGDVERGRAKGVSDINDEAASRGMYYAGARHGDVGMANAGAARDQAGLQGDLAMQKAKQQADLAGIAQGRAVFQQGMVARAAENGMALPVDPYDGAGQSPARAGAARAQTSSQRAGSPGQNGAANVPGAATLSRKKLVSARGFGPAKGLARARPIRKTRPSGSNATRKVAAY